MSNEPVQAILGERRPTIWEWILIAVLPLALCGIVTNPLIYTWRDSTPSVVLWSVTFISIAAGWYLTVFAVWHWRTRYAGKRPFAWAMFFVYSWFVLPAVCYFFAHILPDIRRRGAYAPSAPAPTSPLPPPPKQEIIKSFCFVAGWVLIFWTVVAAIANMVAYAIILPVLADCISMNVPKEFSPRIAHALLCVVKLFGFMVALLGFCCAGAGFGGWLLYISQRTRIETLERTPLLAATDHQGPSRDSLLARIERALQRPARVFRLLAVLAFLFVAVFAAMWSLGGRFLENCDRFEAAQTPSPETKKIIVGLGTVEAGSILTTSNMAMKTFCLSNLPSAVIESKDWKAASGRKTYRRVEHAEPILWPDLLPPKE